MKHGWEIKKLGEVCEKLTDGSHNPPKGIYQSEYIMISSQNVFNDKLTFDNIRYLSEEDFIKEDKRTGVSKGDVLLTIVGTIGRCAVFTGNTKISLQRSVAVIRAKNYIYPRFLMHCLIGKNESLNSKAHGIAQKGLYLKQLSQIPIPIPPLPIQERIVSELDCINGILEKKWEQIKELDALAQSIFYDMFGDPIQNEKGWEVKKLGEVGELARGVSKHRPRNAPELLGGNIPLIQTGDVSNAGMYIEKYNSTYSELGLAQSRLWPLGTLCITIAATIGKCSILTFDACFPDSVVGFIVDDKSTRNEYIYYIFKDLQKILEENAPAVAQKNINLQVLNNQYIPLPPLSLQQTFAAKIEAIEKQKELVKRSIAETETLLASRMQYYFEA